MILSSSYSYLIKIKIIIYCYCYALNFISILAKCGHLGIDRNDLLTITGYREPALAGANVSFDCLPGSIFAGPTSSSCTEDGLWDPDPRRVVCQGESTIINALPLQAM